MAISKEEFVEGIKEAVDEVGDPNSLYNLAIHDFVVLERELTPHDAVLGLKLHAIVVAMQDFGTYVKSRAEG